MTEVLINDSRLACVNNKIAIVTGGGSGIGRALVSLLHSRGATTYFCDINEPAGKAVASSFPSNVHFIQTDVSSFSSLASFFAAVFSKTGQIDLVFANAGVIQQSSIWDDEVSDSGEILEPSMLTFDVTLKGVIFTAKLAMAYFKRNQVVGGALVFTASSSSYNERPMLPLYSVAKHGVLALMRSLRALPAGQRSNIHVAAVAPGGTLTGMVGPEIAARMAATGVAIQQPEFVALALLILASNPELNGQCYVLMGGRGFEAEQKIKETQPLWYGEYPAQQAQAVTQVSFAKVV